MFGLSKSQTKLEKFCIGLAPENLMRPLSDLDEDNPHAVAIAMLLLYQAGKLLSDMHSDQHLKKYYKRVNPDLVILETIMYLHAMLGYSAMDGMYDEDDILSVLNTALGGALATVENLSPITSTEHLSLARNYAPDVQSSTERFAIILEHSCFGSEPILKPAINLNQASVETFMGIRAQAAAFAQAQLPACSEIVENIMEGAL